MTTLPALPAELTIYCVSDLRAQWLACSSAIDADACFIDGAAVDEVDAAGIQLLLSLAASLAGRGCELRLVDASERLVTAIGQLGVAAALLPRAAQEEATA